MRKIATPPPIANTAEVAEDAGPPEKPLRKIKDGWEMPEI